ncbi:MAG: hypothetical protein ACUVSC_05440, partial [Candidatus Fervidibacter sp.]|uniref:hypothetical protein n=1 Tax=Candidatus Fervidibacter sp. TaxID=3100871 RepID=UPI00404A75AB
PDRLNFKAEKIDLRLPIPFRTLKPKLKSEAASQKSRTQKRLRLKILSQKWIHNELGSNLGSSSARQEPHPPANKGNCDAVKQWDGEKKLSSKFAL